MLTQEKKEIVRAARALIADEAHFSKGFFAQDRLQRPVHWSSRDAVSFCARGAIMRTIHDKRSLRATTSFADDIAIELVGTPNALAELNNGPDGYAKVHKLFDEALAA